jgi:uncharacterized OsmC-like protein
MEKPEIILRVKNAFERNGRALELRPSVGQITATTKARIVEGVHCEVSEGRWTTTIDASEKSGGSGAGPDPGFVVRSALAACLAMGYVMWAAHLDVPIWNVEVDVHADFDVRGQHGVEGIPAGYTEIRYEVRLSSSAPEADVQRVADAADRASMVGDVFARPHRLVRTLNVTRVET